MNLLTQVKVDFLRRVLALSSADGKLFDNLCEAFGSFSSIFEASPEKLLRVEGMTEDCAALITLLPSLVRRALVERHPMPKRIDDPALADHLSARYFALSEEILTVVFADKNGKILDLREYGDVRSDNVGTRISSIADTAVAVGAKQLIWAHNHPGGFAIPSADDNTALTLILRACHDLGITVFDHIIIADDDYVSIKESAEEKSNER